MLDEVVKEQVTLSSPCLSLSLSLSLNTMVTIDLMYRETMRALGIPVSMWTQLEFTNRDVDIDYA